MTGPGLDGLMAAHEDCPGSLSRSWRGESGEESGEALGR